MYYERFIRINGKTEMIDELTDLTLYDTDNFRLSIDATPAKYGQILDGSVSFEKATGIRLEKIRGTSICVI